MAATICFHLPFFVLVACKPEAVTPVGLIPRALNQPTTAYFIADGQRSAVPQKHPPPLRPPNPLPRRPKDRHKQAFHVARRDIDQQAPDLTAADCFQMLD